MANGTKYSDVKFSVQEGADPLGIGGFDTGKSTYDPLSTIEKGWERQRQERLIKDQQRREEYQSFVDKLPTFDDFNFKLSKDLNNRVQKMEDYAYSKMKAGGFDFLLKTDEGKSVNKELNNMQREILSIAPFYEKASKVYQQARTIAADPKNKDLIDQELTAQRFQKIQNAETVEELAGALAEGNPVVFKPTPVDMIKEVGERFDTLIDPATKETLGIKSYFDKNTGKLMITTESGIASSKAKKAMSTVYWELKNEDRFSNYINGQYQKAKARGETREDDGMQMSEKDWFINQYMPQLGTQKSVKAIGPAAGSGKDKKFDINPEVTSDGMVYKTLDKAITVPDTIDVYQADGSVKKETVDKAKLSEFGYGQLPDGSYGKYVKFIVSEKTPDNTYSTKEFIAPYENYRNRIKEIYNPVDVAKMEAMEDRLANIQYTAEGSVATETPGWVGRNIARKQPKDIYNVVLKDRTGEPVSDEEQAQFVEMMKSEGIKSPDEAAKVYSSVKQMMRDYNVKSFDEALQIFVDYSNYSDAKKKEIDNFMRKHRLNRVEAIKLLKKENKL